MGELVGGGYTLLYVYYLVWYTDLGGRGVFRRLTSLLLDDGEVNGTANFLVHFSARTSATDVRCQTLGKIFTDPTYSLQNKCRTVDPDRQNLGRSGKLSFFTIYFGEIVLRSGKFQILFWRLDVHVTFKIYCNFRCLQVFLFEI